MKTIVWDELEKAIFARYGELPYIVVKEAMIRNGVNFQAVERINGYHKRHCCYSEAGQRYRQSAIRKAIAKVGANPQDFGEVWQ